MRRGAGRHDRHQTQGQQRVDWRGLGNIVAPFFGGITATAAIARSAANVRAGATSPVSAVIHALLVIMALLVLAPLLSQFAAFRHGGAAADGGMEYERSAQGR